MGIFGGGDEDEIRKLQRQKKAKERAQRKEVLRAFQASKKAEKRRKDIAEKNRKKKK